jgi:hypothetical protein
MRYASILALATVACACGSPSSVAPPSTPAPLPAGTPQADGWEVLAGSPTSPANSRQEDVFFLDGSAG